MPWLSHEVVGKTHTTARFIALRFSLNSHNNRCDLGSVSTFTKRFYPLSLNQGNHTQPKTCRSHHPNTSRPHRPLSVSTGTWPGLSSSSLPDPLQEAPYQSPRAHSVPTLPFQFPCLQPFIASIFLKTESKILTMAMGPLCSSPCGLIPVPPRLLSHTRRFS